MDKQWVGTVAGRLMTSSSVYLHSLTHWVTLKKWKEPLLRVCGGHLIHQNPLHTLIQELLNPINPFRVCLWVWTWLNLPPSHDIRGLIYKCVLAAFSSFSSSTPGRGCQEKHFTWAATIHLWPPWGMESGVLTRSVLLPTDRPWHTLMKVKQESCIYTLETETRLPDRLLIKLRLPWRGVKLNI